MVKTKMIAFFDLEGPLCPIDHAADVLSLIGKKLGKEEDFYQLFQMISLYDDELFLVDKKKNYWPGDTLRLIAPLVVAFAKEKELLRISEKARLTPGAKRLFNYLHEEEIPTYLISTSYQQHAHTIAQKLAHPVENVRCTKLDFSLKPETTKTLEPLFEEIFPKYLKSGLPAVKKDLDRFFFQELPESPFGAVFNSTIVCGGGRKRTEVIEILEQHSLPAAKAFAVGDSITDCQMLAYVREHEGTAVSFNGNNYSLKEASIAFSGESLYPIKYLIEAFPNTKMFAKDAKEKLQEPKKKDEFFIDLVEDVSKEEYEQILQRQQKYRKSLRAKAAELT